MTTDRFNPREGTAYGRCIDCELVLDERADATEHMSQTRQGTRRSHRVRVSNPDRAMRVSTTVSQIVQAHLSEAVDEIAELVHAGHITTEEVEQALSWHSDALDVWRKREEL